MSLRRTLALTLLLGVGAPAAARADGLLIPFLGVNFGGNAGRGIANAIDAKRFDWGASFAFMGAGVLGLEADIARSPDFYGKTDIGGSSVLTATGNLLVGIPIGGQKGVGVRPYALAGLGVMFFFGSHLGVRGDIRYFRTFNDVAFNVINVENPGSLNFARGSAGLILRF